MNKYLSRVTSSARGETFNPLIWPFLIATFAYGIGFTAFVATAGVHASSLYIALMAVHKSLPLLWGLLGVTTVLMGFTFLLFNIPPFGKLSGLLGFMLWLFAGFCWALTGGWLPVFSVALPNSIFWIWQYLSLCKFREEDRVDKITLADYNSGEYDDLANPVDSQSAREDNRGVKRQ